MGERLDTEVTPAEMQAPDGCLWIIGAERLHRRDRHRGTGVRVDGAVSRASCRQNASAGNAITVEAPALIWWLSDVVCGSTRAM